MTLHIWEKYEIELHAELDYDNPYTDVEVWVDLKGPSFNKRCYGFWYGENIFKIRIVATTEGNWDWESGSNTNDSGLNGEKGNFIATKWSKDDLDENSIRRGFLRQSENGHALEYADGTPFFLLGDTWWATPTFRFPWYDDEIKRDIGEEMGFKDMVRLRKKQEFNCVTIITGFPAWAHDGHPAKIYLDDGTLLRSAWQHPYDDNARDMHNEGGRPFLFPGKIPGYENIFPDMDKLNPEYFRYLDRKIDYLNDNGIIPFMEVSRRDISQAWKRFYDWPDSYSRYVKYIFARYQAHSIILSPIHYDYRPDAIPPRCFNEPINKAYSDHGEPPFNTIVSANASPSTFVQFGDEKSAPWLTMHQIGNNREHCYYWYLKQIYNSAKPKPALHGEPYYSGWGMNRKGLYDIGVKGGTPEDDRYVRSGMYGSFLSGGLAGYIYGSTGLVRAAREKEYNVKMWECFEWNSANMIPIFKKFVFSNGDKYKDLEPLQDLLSPNQNHDELSYEGWGYCAATKERDLFMVYFEKGIKAGTIRDVKFNSKYEACYYDVRTGEWLEPVLLQVDDNYNMVELPKKPNDEDWALTLRLVEEKNE